MSTCDVFNSFFPLNIVQNEIQLLSRVFCYSSQVCLSGFWLRNTSLVKVGNPISDGIVFRLRVVPHFSSGIVERAKRERSGKSPHVRKGDTRRVSPFLAWGDFHARSRFARSTIPEEKWGTTRSLHRFRFSPCLMRKRVEKSEAILALLDSFQCISNGKPE